jgi:hypothetical protein
MPKLNPPPYQPLPSSPRLDFPCRNPDRPRTRSPQSRAWRACTEGSSPWGESVVPTSCFCYINTNVHPSFISVHHCQSLLLSNSRSYLLHRALDPTYTSQCLSPLDGPKARLVPFGPPSLSVHSLLSVVFSMVTIRYEQVRSPEDMSYLTVGSGYNLRHPRDAVLVEVVRYHHRRWG